VPPPNEGEDVAELETFIAASEREAKADLRWAYIRFRTDALIAGVAVLMSALLEVFRYVVALAVRYVTGHESGFASAILEAVHLGMIAVSGAAFIVLVAVDVVRFVRLRAGP